MPRERVIVVHLRRPKDAPHEMRSDPFWEFGSFGITKCHDKNLMNPKNARKLSGARLAFAQGGSEGTRLVYVTPPVKIRKHPDGRLEVRWPSGEMPFRYRCAPILVANNAPSDFPKLAASIRKVRRTTPESKLASKYRSGSTCIPEELADELIRIYRRRRREADPSAIACHYEQALPWPPPTIDRDRQQTYTQKLAEAADPRTANRCGGPEGAIPHAPRKGRTYLR